MPAPVLTSADVLALFGRLLPSGYLAPLINPGPGYEILEAYASALARASVATGNLDLALYMMSAPSGVRATGTVQIQRPDGALPEVTLKQGTRVSTSKGRRGFVTTADLFFASGDMGPLDVGVLADAPGYDWNVPGEVTTADGTLLPGDIDTIDLLVEDPILGDLTFTVSQQDPTSGGLPPALDQLGADRGMPRRAGEVDPAYRLRIRSLPDTVSPLAIQRAILSFFAPYGAAPAFVETWDPSVQTGYDVPEGMAGTGVPFFYDDPRPSTAPLNRYLDDQAMAAAFLVVVPQLPVFLEVGFAFDDPAVTLADLTSPMAGLVPGVTGRRGIPAFDIEGADDDVGAFDGVDVQWQGLLAALSSILNDIKAAGVWVAIVIEGS